MWVGEGVHFPLLSSRCAANILTHDCLSRISDSSEPPKGIWIKLQIIFSTSRKCADHAGASFALLIDDIRWSVDPQKQILTSCTLQHGFSPSFSSLQMRRRLRGKLCRWKRNSCCLQGAPCQLSPVGACVCDLQSNSHGPASTLTPTAAVNAGAFDQATDNLQDPCWSTSKVL